MFEKEDEFKIWNSPEIIDWGPAKVRFYVKNDKILFGTLNVPERQWDWLMRAIKTGNIFTV